MPQVFVPKEIADGERRVGLDPEAVQKLVERGTRACVADRQLVLDIEVPDNHPHRLGHRRLGQERFVRLLGAVCINDLNMVGLVPQCGCILW